MTQIFLLGHSNHRLQDDFVTAGSYVKSVPCRECGLNLNKLISPLIYEWDEEFGNPATALEEGIELFWGSFHLVITEEMKFLLESLELPIDYFPTLEGGDNFLSKRTRMHDIKPESGSLLWVRPQLAIEADVQASKNKVCSLCGYFTERVRQITRLRIPESEATKVGIFSVKQNAGETMFVTTKLRELLEKHVNNGIGFYPAGKTI